MTVKEMREYLEEYDEDDILLRLDYDFMEYHELHAPILLSDLLEEGVSRDQILLDSDP